MGLPLIIFRMGAFSYLTPMYPVWAALPFQVYYSTVMDLAVIFFVFHVKNKIKLEGQKLVEKSDFINLQHYKSNETFFNSVVYEK